MAAKCLLQEGCVFYEGKDPIVHFHSLILSKCLQQIRNSINTCYMKGKKYF